MVDIEANMLLFFENDRTGKKREFLELLAKKWGDRIKVGNETIHGREIEMRDTRRSSNAPYYLPFYLSAGPFTNDKASSIYTVSGLYLYSGVMNETYVEELELFHEIFLTACKELKPTFGTAEGTEQGERRPVTDQAEYYGNPYLFCFEPPLFNPAFDPASFLVFLHDKGLAAKLSKIERALDRSELVEIIRKHSERVVESEDGGVGVFKNHYPQAAYPRYFVRRELRRRGIELGEGLAEKYAKQMESFKGRPL